MIDRFFPYLSAAALAFGLLAGWTVRDWKADADVASTLRKAEKQRVEMQKAIDNQSQRYERLIAELEPGRIETRNSIREIYRDVEVPADCSAPAAAVSLLSAARDKANAAASGEFGAELP